VVSAVANALVGAVFLLASAQTMPEDAARAYEKRLAEADAAHRAGQFEIALGLYDQVLTDDARNERALKASAHLLKSTGNLGAALDRYQRVAAVRGLMPDETLELGGWFLENQQADRALALILPLVKEAPADARFRLIEARALSSLGKREAARTVARGVLAADPKNVEAMNLIAATYHWGYGPEFAREWYERALRVDPHNFTAQLGLTALDARADPVAARRTIEQMQSRRGRDKWIDGVAAALDGNPRPTVATGYYQRESEKDLLDVYFGQLRWNLSRSRDLELSATRSQGRVGPPGSAVGTVNAAQAAYAFPVRSRERLTLKGGLANRSDTLGKSQVLPFGSTYWEWGVGEKLSGFVAAGADPYVLTLSSVDGTVDLVGTAASLQRKFSSGFQVQVQASAARVLVNGGEDANRWEGRFQVSREWRLRGAAPLSVAYTFNHFEHDRPIRSPGYFAPRGFTGHTLQGAFAGAIPPRLSGRRLTFSLTGNYTRMAYGGIHDTSLGGELVLAFHLGQGLEMGGLIARSNGSVTVGWPASTSTRIGFGLRYVPPRR